MIATEPTTSKKTRIAVIAIAALMIISTGALFISMALGSNNQQKIDDILLAERREKEARLNQLLEEYGDELTAAADGTNELYFDEFAALRSRVRGFVADNVNALQIRDIKVGDGDELTDINEENSLLYIGWLDDGTVFDSSFDITDGETPNAWREAERVRFPTRASVDFITGFREGMVGRVGGFASGAPICANGRAEDDDDKCNDSNQAIASMRVGGIREITIPFQKAYGDSAFGLIPARAPLKFIVMLVPYVVEPEPSDELYQLYMEFYAQ